jgi:hypothetical protein
VRASGLRYAPESVLCAYWVRNLATKPHFGHDGEENKKFWPDLIFFFSNNSLRFLITDSKYVKPYSLRPLEQWDCGFEFSLRHGYR